MALHSEARMGLVNSRDALPHGPEIAVLRCSDVSDLTNQLHPRPRDGATNKLCSGLQLTWLSANTSPASTCIISSRQNPRFIFCIQRTLTHASCNAITAFIFCTLNKININVIKKKKFMRILEC